jgi:hypothetical protein
MSKEQDGDILAALEASLERIRVERKDAIDRVANAVLFCKGEEVKLAIDIARANIKEVARGGVR